MSPREEQVAKLMKDGSTITPNFRQPTQAEPDLYAQRILICARCPMFREMRGVYEGRGHGPNACMHCGCDMTHVAKLKYAKCKDKENPKW